jgi:protein-S-isoprenylcysteine O-methyltransferase Ste14
MYLAALAAGIALNCGRPISLLPGWWGGPAGIVLIAVGLAIMPFVLRRFRRAGTTFHPHKSASALVTDGPYRFSRNPAYVALTLWYLGIGLVLNNAWVLLLAFVPLVVMDRLVIPGEERRLEAQFGDDYRRYKAQVRRWV